MCGNEQSIPVVAPSSDFSDMLMGRIVGKQLILSTLSWDHIDQYAIKLYEAQCFSKLNGINIEYLDLSRCSIGDHELALICRAVYPALKFLRLDGNRISQEGVESLARSHFANVMFLHLNNNFLAN